MIFFLTLNLIMFTTIMLFITHPLSMGMLILLQTFFICLISSSFINTYWFSYILFLTFLGGLLVLFIYVSSIASNELFKFSMKLISFMLSFMLLILFMTFLYNNVNINIMNLEMKSINENFIFMNNENKMNLNKLYNNQTYLLMMMLIIYLLMALIAAVKITNNIFGPLRTMN